MKTHCVPPVAAWRTHCGLHVEHHRIWFDDARRVTCEVCRTMGKLHLLARGDLPNAELLDRLRECLKASPPAPADPTSPEPQGDEVV